MVRGIEKVQRLSPDASGRFIVMLELLKALSGIRNYRQAIEILDVGGGSPYMTDTLNSSSLDYHLTTIDILPKPKNLKGDYIQGDATNMELKDETYDIVISTDVLEHIPRDKKVDFVKECIRVSRDAVIIAAPFNTACVDEAEHLTNDFNKKLFGQGQPWLEEHFEQTKPELSLIEKVLQKEKLEYEIIGTGNLYNWMLGTHTNLIEAKNGLGHREIENINRRFNEAILTSGDMMPPYYRHFVVVFKRKPQQKVRNQIKALMTPTVDHSSNLTYIHNLAEVVNKRIKGLRKELSSAEAHLLMRGSELEQARQRIDNLQQELAAKEAILDKYRPYMAILQSKPVTIVRSILKSPKRK